MKVIQGFFNPTKSGDRFAGLNSSIRGAVADTIFTSLPKFLQAAGRDYSVQRVPAYQQIDDSFVPVDNQYHLVRSTDNRVVSPHTVTDQYAPLSLMDIADQLQPWCEAGWCMPDGVFSAKNESLELLVLRIDEGEELAEGERFVHYIAFQNPHGSGGTSKGKILHFRVICKNTFGAAISAAADFAITHRVATDDISVQSSIMLKRTQDAIAAWDHVKTHIARLSAKVNQWQGMPLSFAEASELTDQLLDIKASKEPSGQKRNKRDAILRAFAMPQVGTYGRTAYDWLNGVTFVNSSPLAQINTKSKVSGIDRVVRTIDTNGTGFAFEQKAEKLLAALV